MCTDGALNNTQYAALNNIQYGATRTVNKIRRVHKIRRATYQTMYTGTGEVPIKYIWNLCIEDYIYIKDMNVKSINIGFYDDWIKYSDHCPVTIKV